MSVAPDASFATATPVPASVPLSSRRCLDVVVASLALVVLGASVPLLAGATTATAVVIALAPLWVTTLSRSWAMRTLAALALLAIPAGLVLAWHAGPVAGRAWDRSGAVAVALLLLTAVGSAGLVLWARTVLNIRPTVVLLGVGLLLDGVRSAGSTPNALKYALLFPITVLVLAVLLGRLTVLTAAALGVLATIAITNEARSFAAFCVLTAALFVWRARPESRSSRVRILAVLVASAFAAYQIGTDLLVKGFLGEVLQQRSVEQVQNAGSLIAGGRPEWSATRALATQNPLGFGLGAVPSPEDLRTAKTGLATVGIKSDNGYVNNYMFGDAFKLHAIVADLWSNFGLVGIVLGALMVGIVVRSLATSLAGGRPPAIVIFLCLIGLWWLAFGPIYTNLQDVAIIIGVVAPLRGGPDAGR